MRVHLPISFAFTFTALTACAGTAGTPPPASGTGGGAAPHTVQGRILDERGLPVPGAKLIIEPVMHRGTITTSTNSAGHYQSIPLNPQANPYYVIAYKEVTYHGRTYCLRMAGVGHDFKDAFNASAGVVRDFRWSLTGPSDMPRDNIGSHFWGAWLGFDNTSTEDAKFVDWEAQLQITLTPDGPLIDGSTGKTIVTNVRMADGVQDIPAGYYKVSAALVNPDGTKSPLKISTSNEAEDLTDTTTVLFRGFESCGHSGTFVKTTVWISRP